MQRWMVLALVALLSTSAQAVGRGGPEPKSSSHVFVHNAVPAPRYARRDAGILRPAVSAIRHWIASFYGHGERLNALTSTGERFNPNAFTAAHRTLPFGTKLRVSYRGHSVVVRVNDRGPAAWTGRSLDLAYGAARAIGLDRAGAGAVEVAIVE